MAIWWAPGATPAALDNHRYGLDMTEGMLALALPNAKKASATNVKFLKGTIEAIPLPRTRSTS